MVVFPNCKINLGLHIIEKRKDGFHELESLFYPLKLSDALEIIPSTDLATTFSSSGIEIPDHGSKNLCEKAYELLKVAYDLPPINIHLHKNTPIGAGLGGGSADAAFTLKLLNELFSLNIETEKLCNYAAILGSDCAFFIHNVPSIAKGRGEILSPYNLKLQGLTLLLIKPNIHISTAVAYAGVTPQKPANALSDILSKPPQHWKNNLVNDFEESVFKQFPEIKKIKDMLYRSGAIYASMSGSGASVFGLFEGEDLLPNTNQFTNYFVWKEKL